MDRLAYCHPFNFNHLPGREGVPSLIQALENDLDFEMTNTTTNLELTILEDLLNDECKCESSHKTTVCSGSVVARKHRSCGPSFNICSNSRDWNLSVISTPGKRCKQCKENVSECWSIRPV